MPASSTVRIALIATSDEEADAMRVRMVRAGHTITTTFTTPVDLNDFQEFDLVIVSPTAEMPPPREVEVEVIDRDSYTTIQERLNRETA